MAKPVSKPNSTLGTKSEKASREKPRVMISEVWGGTLLNN
jgi:hypothetical protein